MSQPLPPDVIAALKASNKIEAIRLLRAHTGLGLQDAKEAVEAGAMPAQARAQSALPTSLPAEALDALQRGNQLAAIKIVRARLGIGLKDAKDIVDRALAQGAGGESDLKQRLAPGEVPTNRVGLALPLIVMAVVAAMIWWFVAGR